MAREDSFIEVSEVLEVLKDRVQVLSLPFTSYLTLSKFLSLAKYSILSSVK